jgi:WD40 repeat protein
VHRLFSFAERRPLALLRLAALALLTTSSIAACRRGQALKQSSARPAASVSATAARLTSSVTSAEPAAPHLQLPFYYDRPLDPTELAGKTLRELEILRATIHARAGLVFLETHLRNYFARTPGYRPGGYDGRKLTSVDEHNLRILAAYRAAMPRAELRQRWDRMWDDHRYATDVAPNHRVAFSADGDVVAVGPSRVAARQPLSLFRTTTGERISTINWAGHVLHAVYVGSNGVVVVSNYDAQIGGWRSAHPRRSVIVGAKARPDGSRDPEPWWACVSTDGTRVAVEQPSGVASFDLTSRDPGRTVPLPPARVIPDECTFTGPRTAFIKRDLFGASYLLDVTSQKLTELAVPAGSNRISPDGTWLARWDEDPSGKRGDVEVWTLRGRPQRSRLLPASAGSLPMAFSPDGARLIMVGAGEQMFLWDIATGTQTLWRERSEYLRWDTVELAQDSLDAPLHRELTEDRPTPPRQYVPDRATKLLFSPDGSVVLAAYTRGYLELRDSRSGRPIETFRGHRPWTDDELWEMTLLADKLGLPLEPLPPGLPEFVDPLKHLSALDGRLPDKLLRDASRARLYILRNAIFARRGARIEGPTLRQLFVGATWYTPSATYSAELLTPIDRDNITRIEQRERALGGPIGDAGLRAAMKSDAGPEAG